MSRTHKDSPNARNNRPRRSSRQRAISVRAVRRDPPDLRKLSRALIQLALEETAATTAETKPKDFGRPTSSAEDAADE